MKVNELSVENFKGIDSLTFQPRLLNVIVGRNNTGKTSILETLATMLDSDFIGKYYQETPSSIINYFVNSSRIDASLSNAITEQRRVIVERMNTQEILDEMTAGILENIGNIQFDLHKGYLRRTRIGSQGVKALKTLVGMDASEFQDLVQTAVGDELLADIIKRLTQECVKVSRGESETFFFSESFRVTQENLTVAVLKKALGEQPEFDKGIISHSIFRYIFNPISRFRTYNISALPRDSNVTLVKEPLQYLQRILEKNKGNQELALEIEEILKEEKIVPNLLRFDFTEVVFETEEGKKSVKFKRMGDGFQALVAVLALLKSINDSQTIFLIEEPEVHMHPGYVRELVKYLAQVSASLHVQLFITTHSYDLIQSLLEEDSPENLRTFLRENLLLLRLTRSGDTVIGESIRYDEAQSDISNLQLDLRGI